MKILLSHYPVVVSGGAERGTIDLGVALYKRGYEVYLWGPWFDCPQFVSIAESEGLKIISQKATSYLTEPILLRKACKELDIDIIISSSRRYNIFSHFATKKLPTQHIPVLRGPISTWDEFRRLRRFHSLALPKIRYYWLKVLRKAPIIICISKAVAHDTQKVLGCESSKTFVIYNAIGVTTGNVTNVVSKKKSSPFQLIIVGRLHPEKRPHLIVPLMKTLLRYDKDISLYVAGDGEYRDELSRMISDDGLDKNIRLLGHCDNIEKWYQDSHVLIHFRSDEGFGRVYLEAQLNSLPVVCVRGGAASEVVCEGETGYLHDVQDINGMAQSILRLKREPFKYHEMSKRALEWAGNKFSLDVMVRQYEMIITKIVSQVRKNQEEV